MRVAICLALWAMTVFGCIVGIAYYDMLNTLPIWAIVLLLVWVVVLWIFSVLWASVAQ